MKPISTPDAPAAIGTYSQAIRAGDTVYLSGQIPLDPKTMQLVDGFENQVKRVFDNLQAVCKAAGGDFGRVVRVTIYLIDLANFPKVNEIMATYFKEPFPARVTVGVSSLPRGALVEIDAVQ
jgi:reactive intermediate/imine deaminase